MPSTIADPPPLLPAYPHLNAYLLYQQLAIGGAQRGQGLLDEAAFPNGCRHSPSTYSVKREETPGRVIAPLHSGAVPGDPVQPPHEEVVVAQLGEAAHGDLEGVLGQVAGKLRVARLVQHLGKDVPIVAGHQEVACSAITGPQPRDQHMVGRRTAKSLRHG